MVRASRRRAARRKGLRLTDALPLPPPGRRAALSRDELEAMLPAVLDLCTGFPGQRRPATADALAAAFLRLVADAEHDIRRRLAARLAEADGAPPALIRALVLDDIDIARPLIAASPVLQDSDVLPILTRAMVAHRLAVAEEPAPDAFTAGGRIDPGVILHPDAMARLVQAAQRVASAPDGLAQSPQLSAELARGLFAWVSETLRGVLEARFALAPGVLALELAAAAATQAWRHDPAPATSVPPPLAVTRGIQAEPDGTEERLVAKLEASGRLKPGYLLRVLREGRLSLFVTGLSALADLPAEQVRRAVQAPTPEALALACNAVGLDRSAFPTVLSLVRSLTGDRPGEAAGSAAAVSQAFARQRPAAATAFLARMRPEAA